MVVAAAAGAGVGGGVLPTLTSNSQDISWVSYKSYQFRHYLPHMLHASEDSLQA